MKIYFFISDMQCPCDGNCSNQGICDFSTGTCVCDSGFQGDTCQGKTLSLVDNALLLYTTDWETLVVAPYDFS